MSTSRSHDEVTCAISDSAPSRNAVIADNDPARCKAVETFVEEQTFLYWTLAGLQPDKTYLPQVVRTIAERYPDFMDRWSTPRPQSDRDPEMILDMGKWLAARHAHDEKRESVSQVGLTDPRTKAAYDYLQVCKAAGCASLLPYEAWKRHAWAAVAHPATPSRDRTPPVALPALIEGHYHIGSDGTIQALREALAMNTFRAVDDSPWPTAPLNRGDSKGHAQLRPVVLDEQPMMPPEEIEAWREAMWRQREELNDLDVDMLDAMNAIWLGQAKTENHGAVATVDAILKLRGVQKKKGGRGDRGGYEPEQRVETLRTIGHLQNVWVTMAAIPVYEPTTKEKRKRSARVLQSRAFVITDRAGQLRFDGYMDVDSFIFRPGDVLARVLFGPGRQTALMSAMALRYNPYNQTWEKRLTRYLSWQWRCRAKNSNYTQPFKIGTLMQAAGEAVDSRRPIRTRERLERALDTLLKDNVISGWQYDRWNEADGSVKGWVSTWLHATLLIEPPDIIRDQYKKLETLGTRPKALPASLSEQLEGKRKSLGLSQMQAAEHLGISQPYWSQIVKGKKGFDALSPSLRGRLQEWLKSDPALNVITQ